MIKYKPFKSTVMLFTHTTGYVLDIKDFMKWFPFCSNQSLPVREGDGSFSIELDNGRDFTFLDVVTWFLNDYTCRKPLRIEFDYYQDHTNITVVFHYCSVSFTFFDYE